MQFGLDRSRGALALVIALVTSCAEQNVTVIDDAEADVAPTDDDVLDAAPSDDTGERPDVVTPRDAQTPSDAVGDRPMVVEAGLDATPDIVDVGVDSALDVAPDIALDAGIDARLDVAPDVAMDAPREVGVDATVDAPETAPDVAPDVARDAGPAGLVVPLPSSTVMTSVTRLGQRGFVIASVEDTDESTPEPERLSLRYAERVGHGLVTSDPFSVAVTTTSPGYDNPIVLTGSLGPEHFFVVVMLPGGAMSLRLFARRGGVFVDLGATPLAAGGTFTDAPMSFSAHPVDDTRHLLGYRERDTGQPFRYRLIVRTGDTIRFGAPVTRPSTFPGLSSGESQADPALMRVGPTTFVEARPGYVYTPGYLGTWTLEVSSDNTLSASGPTTQATVERTMTPEVAADGRGAAVIAYQTYSVRDWQYGMYDHAARRLTQVGPLGTSGSQSIRSHQGESTDRFLGGAFYVRLPGANETPMVPLYRIDAATRAVTSVATVPALWNCYRTPQMVRVGTIAAYTDCARVVFVDLLPRCGDRVVDTGERCDDGDNLDGDGCSAGCTLE